MKIQKKLQIFALTILFAFSANIFAQEATIPVAITEAPAIVEEAVTEAPAAVEEAVAVVEETVAEAPVVAEEAVAVVEETVAETSAVVEEAVAVVEETVAEAPAAAVEEAVAEAPATEEAPAEKATKSRFTATWWALFPAFLAIGLALITKEVYSSLFIGIVVGALFVNEFAILPTIDFVINNGLITAVSETAGIFIFLVILGSLVYLINRSGAAYAFGEWARTHIKTRVGSQLCTFLLGVLIFIDDYFNCLTVGSVMTPITDTKKVSRAKLAYIIDATAAPICMIAPISSWAAAVSEYTEGTGYSGIALFCKSIPFNFYSLLTLLFVVLIILMKFDFGPMRRFEKNAQENDDLFTVKPNETSGNIVAVKGKGKIADLVAPIVFLVVICVAALLHVGGIADEGVGFVDAFGNTDATVGLPWGATIVLLLVIAYYICRRIFNLRDAMKCLPEGFCAMVPAIIILTMAASLKNMTNALEAKVFIENVMTNAAPNLANFLPAVIFVVASIIAFSTGTSWGTFGILIPIVIAVFDPTSPLLYIGMSACLAGAVCGDHCSPISDTTIMSSAGAQCDHVSHVSTQLPYAITVASISFISFLIAGFIHNWFVVFPISVVLLVGTLFIIKKITTKKA